MFSWFMSILARNTREPSANSPFFMPSNSSRFSSMLRSRHGLSTPGSVNPPRCLEMVSASWSST